MRILVTGGAGFIGSHVVSALADAGDDVLVMDALLDTVHPAGEPHVDPRARFVKGDVREPAECRAALGGVDVVFHEAAMVGLGVDMADLPSYASHNDVGAAVLLAEMAAAGVRRLVLASSMVVYGEGAYECAQHGQVQAAPRRPADLDEGRFEPPCPVCGSQLSATLVGEDARPDPRNAYATSKLAQEHYASGWARETASTAIALRYHNVYGPGMPRDTPYAGVAAIFRSALENGDAPTVFEDGGQLRDFIHVTDIAAANVAALTALEGQAPGSFRAYNIGSGTPHTVGEMASALCDAVGGDLTPAVTGRYRLGDVRHIMADSSRARQEFQWTPAVSFQEGMRRFVTDPLRGPAAAGR
ncbi:MAG TPA: NAD-dependent epimerase/dehydratase family protein [Frankiaceae bacterium]|jgi:dTDP-L-rhamnose 4-epimerase|nr:NAD-dependent epimerase/dehydratase family protein [Frankiaceae bacterium]